MAIIGPNSFGGPVRAPLDCACPTAPGLPSITQPPNLIPTASPCDDSAPGNQPVEDAAFQCSLGVTFQGVVDNARRISHTLGFRPYRVYLVWQVRNRSRDFVEHCRAELMPVRVVTMDSVDLTAEVWGQDMSGGISLRELSPQQVTEDILRGFIDGEDWAQKSNDREFFYEIVMHARCADHVQKRRRFIFSSEPFLKAGSFEFRIALTEQKVARSRDGVDQTIGTETDDGTPVGTMPRLVT